MYASTGSSNSHKRSRPNDSDSDSDEGTADDGSLAGTVDLGEEDDLEPAPWNPDPNRKECIVQPVPHSGVLKANAKHEFKMISVWNFKGGVGKTTTNFSLGYALANQGKKVMFVDAIP